MKKTAIITGADGGMGTEITRAVAMAGYHVIMLCYTAFRGEERRSQLILDTKNEDIEVMQVDLSTDIRQGNQRRPADEQCRYHAHPLQPDRRRIRIYRSGELPGSFPADPPPASAHARRHTDCQHGIVHLCHRRKIGPHFFTHGKEGSFWRIPIYSNTKLALWLFTRKLAEMLKDKGITVNAADPGIVSTNIISMDMWFDPLTDILFRPFIRTPRQGADTAIRLLLAPELEGVTGQMFASGKQRKLKEKYLNHPQAESLWADTEKLLHNYLSTTEKEPGRNE